MGTDINVSCLGPKQNFQIQLSVLLKILYETKSRKRKEKKKKVFNFAKIENYKKVLNFHNIKYHITFLITPIPGQQCLASDSLLDFVKLEY